MITGLPESFSEVISKNNNLRRYLLNLSQGKPATPRSWLYEDVEDPIDVRKEWMNKLETLANGSTFEQEVFQFDVSQTEKWGPQGEIAPIDELLSDIVLPSFSKARSPVPEAFKTAEWELAKDNVIRILKRKQVFGIRPASYDRVVDDMRVRDTLESNSGWPDFTRRNNPEVKQRAIAAAADGEWSKYPAIALFRNYRQKTRLVWMFPMAANVYEGSYYQPLQSAIINANLGFYAPWVGFDAVRNLISKAYQAGKYVAASDFSATDEHFIPRASFEVFDVLVTLLARGYATGLRQSLSNMHKIPLVIGVDRMITGDHGVSSGSNWTNFIETVFDHIFSFYVRDRERGAVKGLYAIGDDMAWFSDNYDDAFSEKLERYGKEVGQDIKAEKTTNYPDKVKTLQRLFQRGYSRPDGKLRGVYSTIRALNSSIYPEKYHNPKLWSSDMFCARQYMILENCVDHPLFEDFVKFVVRGQKDLIPFAKKSSADLHKITRMSKLLPGLNPTYNQERRDTSLASFASIAIAREL